MLVIIEKPSLAGAVDVHLRNAYPGETLQYVIAHAYGMPFVFDYPKNLRWHDYPYVQPARYRLDESAQRSVDLTGYPRSTPLDLNKLEPGQAAIACCNAHWTAISAVVRMRLHLERLGVIQSWNGTYVFVTLASGEIPASLRTPLSAEAENLAVAQHALKADFDFSFLVNSAGLLTRCYHAAGGTAENPVFSKYTIQTLYALRHDHQVPPRYTGEGSFIQRLHAWSGTGRYSGERASIGSCSSQAELVDSLVRYGLVDRYRAQSARTLHVTPLGYAFLDKLHPGCEDRDLPFRLKLWQTDPTPAHREAAGRYLRTWFGRQKSFMERAGR